MKKRSKLLTLLLSSTLVCTNMGIVYAADTVSTGSPETVLESSAAENAQAESAADQAGTPKGSALKDDRAETPEGPEAEKDQTQTPENPKTETDQTETSESPETETEKDQTEASTESKAENDQTEAPAESETETTGTSKDQDTESETESATTDEEVSEEQESETETDSTDTETSGDYANENAGAVTPSSLIGVDYTTIRDQYDGVTNVIKQYQFSDSYAANTIMESYLDENGNLILVISQGSAVVPENAVNSNVHNDSAPTVDGNFNGWEEIPVSYEYNWDNSSNCWENGCWTTDPETGKDVCYKTETGTYDSNVRHEMQLYCDDKDVYLKIKYASIYGSHANGDDFNFYVDGVEAKFELTWPDGSPITGTDAACGTYLIDVRNGNSGSSYSIVDGACAYYHVTENGLNNELELRIPLEALQAQNGNINLDNYSMIQFFTQNLMYRKISAAGSPTGSVPFAAAAFLGIPASYVWLKKRTFL